MKTVCVAVVALSLISVCCSAPLACDKLSKPIEGLPDVTGRWYFIGMTASFCLPTSLLNAILWPSITMDYVSKGKPDIYNLTININANGFCYNDTFPNLVKSNYMSEVDKNDAPSGDRLHLFQTGCPDCYVALGNTVFFRYMIIASRRKTLTAAELEEFEMQASCHDLTKPQYMNTDFGVEHCRSSDTITDEENEEIFAKIRERVKSMGQLIIQCIIEAIVYAIKKAVGWI